MEYKRRVDVEPKQGTTYLYRRKLPLLIRLRLWFNNVIR